MGSYRSIISSDDSTFHWCNGIFRFNISAIVTALLMARPMAFKTIVLDPDDDADADPSDCLLQ